MQGPVAHPAQGPEAESVGPRPFGPEGGIQLDGGPDPSQSSLLSGRSVYV